VRSDRAEVADALEAVYERQLLAASDRLEPDVVVTIESTPPGPRVLVGGRTIRIPHPSQLVHYAHLVLVNIAAAEARDSTVLHGGAVALGGCAVALVGASGWGKTTLTIELVRRGSGFLSDDFVVLSDQGLVHPFPRRANLTASTARMVGVVPSPSEVRLDGFGGVSKWMIDIDSMFPGGLSAEVPLGDLFVLAAPAATTASENVIADEPRQWRLELDHVPAGFATMLAGLPGVVHTSVDERAAPPRAAVSVAGRAGFVAALDTLCAERDVTVLSAQHSAQSEPTFEGEATVTQVDVDRALPDILRHCLSLSGSRFVYGTDPATLVQSVARLRGALELAGARVHMLAPGSLASTARAIELTVAGNRG
jgi:hypothetical protein